MTLAVLLACGLALVPFEKPGVSAQTSQKPNIVFVLTDDNGTQTYESFMPRTKSLIGDAGLTFVNATYSHSLCCPSRASIERGQYPHNTHVYKNSPPNGGFQTFKAGVELGTPMRPTSTRQGTGPAISASI
jgi:N-acetylglucosamine-6-sulfatase